MNKLLQTVLIVAVLSTGTMASGATGSFPETIETGATINVTKYHYWSRGRNSNYK